MFSNQNGFPMEPHHFLEDLRIAASSFSHFILSLPDILEKGDKWQPCLRHGKTQSKNNNNNNKKPKNLSNHKGQNQTRSLLYSTRCPMGWRRSGFTQDSDKITPNIASGRKQILNKCEQIGEWKQSLGLKASFHEAQGTMLLRRRSHPGDIVSPSCPRLRGSTQGQVRTHLDRRKLAVIS